MQGWGEVGSCYPRIPPAFQFGFLPESRILVTEQACGLGSTNSQTSSFTDATLSLPEACWARVVAAHSAASAVASDDSYSHIKDHWDFRSSNIPLAQLALLRKLGT